MCSVYIGAKNATDAITCKSDDMSGVRQKQTTMLLMHRKKRTLYARYLTVDLKDHILIILIAQQIFGFWIITIRLSIFFLLLLEPLLLRRCRIALLLTRDFL